MDPFPNAFLWGATVLGHQVEGGNYASDWWRWEQRPGRILDGSTSKRASGFRERFAADIELAASFGLNALFFSCEWSRIEPEEGQFDAEAIQFYSNLAATMRGHGMEPVCALQHVTVPRWFAERSGWTHPNAPELFARYAQRLAEAMAPHCRWWMPLHEPGEWIRMAYREKRWPVSSRHLGSRKRALRNLARAHSSAYRILHELQSDARVGLSILVRRPLPLSPDRLEDFLAAGEDAKHSIHGFLDAVSNVNSQSRCADFLGVAYYGRDRVRGSWTRRPKAVFETGGATMSLESDPRQLRETLLELKSLSLPILITGNGIATDNDSERCRYLVAHVDALRSAIAEGVDVRGYMHRSLLDGFEWEAGYTQRYGLVHVDRNTLSRTPNPSLLLYEQLCREGRLGPGTVGRYCGKEFERAAAY